jgi:DNA-binding GntR family transcriptional regulator
MLAQRPDTPKKNRAARESGPDARDHGCSRADLVVESIGAALLAGRLVPGQKLIEADLSQLHGISRGPVREALKRLEAQGIVTLTRHRGAYIRAFSRAETGELLEVLEALTAVMARLAAEAVAAGADSAAVQGAQAQLEAWRVGEPGLLAERRHFYDVLLAIGGNRALAAILPVMSIHLLRLQVQPFFSSAELADRAAEYGAITEAVVAGDAARAVAAMRRHMERMRTRLDRLPDRAFAEEARRPRAD